MKKVFFFDVDGTLLPHGSKNGMDEKTIYALNELRKAGHDVVLTTGKSESMIKEELAAIGTSNHITMNGAQIVVENRVENLEVVDEEALKQLEEFARENDLMLGYQTRDEYFLTNLNIDNDAAKEILANMSLKMPTVKEGIKKDAKISQLWFLGDLTNLNFAKPIFEGYRLLKWHENGCDIVIDYVSKAYAIEKYLELVYPNTAVKTYSFGDGNNDLEMFKLTDVSVAMGNAIPKLKEIATDVTTTCDELGVYEYLVKEGLIEEKK